MAGVVPGGWSPGGWNPQPVGPSPSYPTSPSSPAPAYPMAPAPAPAYPMAPAPAPAYPTTPQYSAPAYPTAPAPAQATSFGGAAGSGSQAADPNANPFGTKSLDWGGNDSDPNSKTVRLRDRLKEADVERRKAEEEADKRERAAEIRREERMKKIEYMQNMPDNQPAGTGKCRSSVRWLGHSFFSLTQNLSFNSGGIYV